MKKKLLSLLIVFAMLLSMSGVTVDAHAADEVVPVDFYITPDKTVANPGDTITYTAYLGPIADFGAANFTLLLPEGLTFVAGSAQVSEVLKEVAVEGECTFVERTLTFMYGAIYGSYTSEENTVVMTFQCTVNEGVLGDYQISINEDTADFADFENFQTYPGLAIHTDASKVTVVKKPVPATGIALNKTALTLKEGMEETLIATLTPENSTDPITWASADDSVATVDQAGKVTAVAKGSTTITVTAGAVSTTCQVTVECAHTNTTDYPAVDSTCTVQGNGEYTVCNDCGAVIAGSDEKLPLDAENHVHTTEHPAESGSCVQPGHDTYTTCDDCGVVISGSDAPVAGPHGTYVEKAEEIYLMSAADCENAAVYYKSCELCGIAHETETFTYGEALGHDFADATCTAPKTCTVCGATEGEALGHSFTNYISNNDATCTEDGTKTAQCDRCDVTDTLADLGSALGHDFADATCTAPKTCIACGATEGDALGHSHATEWSKGESGHWHECSACGDKADLADHDFGTEGDNCLICQYERAHVHRLTLVAGTAANCTEAGRMDYYTCSGCEDWFMDAAGTVVIADKASVVIPALGHDYAEATCLLPKTCKACGATEGEALGHSFTNYISNNDATCTADGTKTAQCDRCDVTDTLADEGSALGHDFADATCTEPKTCNACGLTEGEALGHSYGTEWSKGESGHWHECTACGHKIDEAEHEYDENDICTVCQYEKIHVHELTLVPGTAATCTAGGVMDYYTCSGCEDWFADAAGTVVITDKLSVNLEALGHNYADATCTAPETCENCGETAGEALDHEDANQDGMCDRCEENLNPEQKPEGGSPDTGDRVFVWFALIALSLFGCLAVVLGKKRFAE